MKGYNTRMALSVVLVSFNSEKEFRAFFPSVYHRVREEVDSAEFILIDNHSVDLGIDHIRETYPDVRIRVEEENLYFGPAANIGIAQARNDLVLLLNPDVGMERLNFGAIRGMFVTHPRLFSLHPFIRDPRTGVAEKKFWLGMRRGSIDIGESAVGGEADGMEIPFATGGAVFLRREMFLQLGGFDPLFVPFYWEDVDLGVRAMRAGLENRYIAGSVFVHAHSTIIRRHHHDREIRSIYERNRLFFFYKHASFFSRSFLSHLLLLFPRLFSSRFGDRSFWSGFFLFLRDWRRVAAARRATGRKRFPVSFARVVRRFRDRIAHE
jgi:GT2 family glycosyltransferase